MDLSVNIDVTSTRLRYRCCSQSKSTERNQAVIDGRAG